MMSVLETQQPLDRSEIDAGYRESARQGRAGIVRGSRRFASDCPAQAVNGIQIGAEPDNRHCWDCDSTLVMTVGT